MVAGDREAREAPRTVLMGEPRLAAHDLWREMPAEKAAQIRHLLRRQEDELEFRQRIALRQLQAALQVLRPVGMEARRPKARPPGLGVGGGEGEAQQAFALGQELVEIVGELGGIDDAEQLDITRLEHDAVVGRCPSRYGGRAASG